MKRARKLATAPIQRPFALLRAACRSRWCSAMLVVAALVAPLLPRDARACPNCAVGRLARQQVCDDDGFAFNLSAVALPFLVIGAVSRYAERNPRGASEPR